MRSVCAPYAPAPCVHRVCLRCSATGALSLIRRQEQRDRELDGSSLRLGDSMPRVGRDHRTGALEMGIQVELPPCLGVESSCMTGGDGGAVNRAGLD